MKNKRCLFTSICLFLLGYCHAQVEKGDQIWALSNSSSWSFDNVLSGDNVYFSAFTNIGYDRMISKRIMVGGSLRHADATIGVTYDGKSQLFPYHSLDFAHRIRYYMTTGKWAAFLFLDNSIGFRDYAKVSIDFSFPFASYEDTFGYQSFAGVGLQYFLNKNVSLESKLGTTLFETGDHYNDARQLYLRLGIQYLFKGKWDQATDSMAIGILKKGNTAIFGGLTLNQNFDENRTGYFNISPSVKYFLTDRFNIGGSISYTHHKFSTNNQDLMSFGIGAEYFFQVANRLFLSPGLQVSYGFDGNTFAQISQRYWVIPVSLDLSYFHRQKRLYLGTSYRNRTTTYRRSIQKRTSESVILYTGLDYYVSNNFYFNSRLNFSALRTTVDGVSTNLFGTGIDRINLKFGLGFWLGR